MSRSPTWSRDMTLLQRIVHAHPSYDHPDIRFGYRYADILDASDAAGPIGIDHGRFHDTYKT